MKIIKNNYQDSKDDFKMRFFKPRFITCPHCKSELEFTLSDVTTERTPNGANYITCEACHQHIKLDKTELS